MKKALLPLLIVAALSGYQRFRHPDTPGAKMDGDHDGIPCEDQFGVHR